MQRQPRFPDELTLEDSPPQSTVRRSGRGASPRAILTRASDYLDRTFADGYGCLTSESPNFERAQPTPPETFSAIVVSELLCDVAGAGTTRCPAGAPVRALSPHPERSPHHCLSNGLAQYLRRQRHPSGWVHFFEDQTLLPADVDCSALAAASLFRRGALSQSELSSTMDALVANTNSRGIIQVYRSPCAEREGLTDPVVAANALYAINLAGCAHRALASERYVADALLHHSYESGSRYYQSPDTFLFVVSRLVASYDRYDAWRSPLRIALRRRANQRRNSIELAQWLAAVHHSQQRNNTATTGARSEVVDDDDVSLGCAAEAAAQELASGQRHDGSWPAAALFKYGRRNVYFGSPVLTTAFALAALTARAAAPQRRSVMMVRQMSHS